jgi:hypothetical protein
MSEPLTFTFQVSDLRVAHSKIAAVRAYLRDEGKYEMANVLDEALEVLEVQEPCDSERVDSI